MLKLYINRAVDTARRESMERDFPGFERFEAVDGMVFASDDYNDRGMPRWRSDVSYVLDPPKHGASRLSPTEWGCAASHISAWQYFLATDHETAVILEDDVRPTSLGARHGIEWEVTNGLRWANYPDDYNIIYLFSPNHPGQRIGLTPDGRVKWCRSHMGVMMTRAGAAAAIEAMTPIYYMQDTQLERINASATKHYDYPADMGELPKIEMYGLWSGLVEHNEHAKTSTMTKDGSKPWIREGMLP